MFADIEDAQASQATAISAASQQISIALGVAVAGGILEAHSLLTGEAIDAHAFTIAFLIVAGITATAALPFCLMPRDAGHAVSGHALKEEMKKAEGRQPAAI